MKKVKFLIYILLAITIAITLLILKKCNKYKDYTSESTLNRLSIVFEYIKGYTYDYGYVPDSEAYFEHIKSDKSHLTANFPNFEFPGVNAKDFFITSNEEFIFVWLFSEPNVKQDTIHISEMCFTDFLTKRSHLVAQYGYPPPCGYKMIYIKKNNKTVELPGINEKLYSAIFDIRDIQIEQNPENFQLIPCCFHIVYNNDILAINPVFKDDRCLINRQLYNIIDNKLQFLKEKYDGYDFYIEFFIDCMQ